VYCLSALTQVWRRKAGRLQPGPHAVRSGRGLGPRTLRVILISTLEVRKYTSRSTQRRPHLWRARKPAVNLCGAQPRDEGETHGAGKYYGVCRR
jgi:hypothetical protein